MPAVDVFALLTRRVLQEHTAALAAEACAWAVGLSDQPHLVRRPGRLARSGGTLGDRAASGQRLGEEADTLLDVGDARPGSFRDALSALTPGGRVYAELFEEQVLGPFVHDVCVRAVERAPAVAPDAWEELVDDLGDDDPAEVVRVAEWEAPLQAEALHLVLATLGDVPLVEVEAEGLPLSVVRAAEGHARDAAAGAAPLPGEDLSGAQFLAEVALGSGELSLPVVAQDAEAAVRLLLGEGLDGEEVLRLLPRLPVTQEAAVEIARLVEAAGPAGNPDP